MQNKCIELNEFLDYDFEDDSLDGRISYPPKVSTSHHVIRATRTFL